MNYLITAVTPDEYPTLVELWEASVRATHGFISEADIKYFRPLILNNYLKELELRAARDPDGKILGFSGVLNRKLELLFVHPDFLGAGIGFQLLEYAVKNLKVTKVDVNEQNPRAIAFYKRYGFVVTHRSETDSAGKPYPILYMSLPGSLLQRLLSYLIPSFK